MQRAKAGKRPVAPVVFTTEHLPPAQRLDAWNAAFGTLNEIRIAEPADAPPLRGEHWRLGGMVFGVNQVPDSHFLRSPQRARRDGLDH